VCASCRAATMAAWSPTHGASVACKSRRRLFSGPGFCCRFRECNRSPPLMGVILNGIDEEGVDMVSFVLTCSFPLPCTDLRARRGSIPTTVASSSATIGLGRFCSEMPSPSGTLLWPGSFSCVYSSECDAWSEPTPTLQGKLMLGKLLMPCSQWSSAAAMAAHPPAEAIARLPRPLLARGISPWPHLCQDPMK
jgi:hypothetical protein